MTRKDKTHLYEGMFILSATLSEEARSKALDRVLNSITKRGGSVEKTFPLGRKKLAYPIEEKREGHYYLVYFNLNASSVSETWEEYHLNEDLLRFMNIRCDVIPEEISLEPVTSA